MKHCHPSYCTLPDREPRVLLEPVQIVELACKRLGVDYEGLKTAIKTREVTNHRYMIMYLMKQYTSMSLRSIGHLFGSRGHDTTISALKQAKSFIETERDFRDKYEDLVDYIYN